MDPHAHLAAALRTLIDARHADPLAYHPPVSGIAYWARRDRPAARSLPRLVAAGLRRGYRLSA